MRFKKKTSLKPKITPPAKLLKPNQKRGLSAEDRLELAVLTQLAENARYGNKSVPEELDPNSKNGKPMIDDWDDDARIRRLDHERARAEREAERRAVRSEVAVVDLETKHDSVYINPKIADEFDAIFA